MHAWEQIQKTVDYIDAHIGEEIDIEGLAGMAYLSPFYYQRLFKRLVKKPVAEYISLRRMAKATELLSDPNARILDTALLLGFSSHEHFTRTFKSAFGMTPEKYRACPRPMNVTTKPELSLNYILIDEGVPLVTDGIVLEINRKRLDEPLLFLGMEKETPVSLLADLELTPGEDPLNALWDGFHEKKGSVLGCEANREEVGVALPSDREGYFRYFAGTVWDPKPVIDGFTAWSLPAGEYIACAFEAESFQALVMDALYKAQQYLYNVWLPKHNIATLPFCAERYESHGPGTTGMEVWVRVSD